MMTLYHGTTIEKAHSIRANGFNPFTHFAAKRKTAAWYANAHHGIVLEVKVSPEQIEWRPKPSAGIAINRERLFIYG